jgi:hypothetical protein
VQHGPGHGPRVLRSAIQVQLGQGADLLPLALGDQPLHDTDRPACPFGGPLGMPVQHPLELGPGQRPQTSQRQHPVRTSGWRGLGAPPAESSFVGVGHREHRGLAAAGTLVDRSCVAWPALPDVAQEVVRTQADVVARSLRAGGHQALTERGKRLLPTGPEFVVVRPAVPALARAPLHEGSGVQEAQRVAAIGRHVGAEQAVAEVASTAGLERHGLVQEGDDVAALPLEPAPLRGVAAAVVPPSIPAALAVRHPTQPAVHGVIARDPDDVASQHRVERRSGDQGLEKLQPVGRGACPGGRVRRQGQSRGAHSASPQTVCKAAENSGEWRSGCP